MPSNPVMNPLSKLTLIVCSANVHKQIVHKTQSVSESTYPYRMTKDNQIFGAKMATLDLGYSLWREEGLKTDCTANT